MLCNIFNMKRPVKNRLPYYSYKPLNALLLSVFSSRTTSCLWLAVKHFAEIGNILWDILHPVLVNGLYS